MCLFVLKVSSVYLEKSVFSILLAFNEDSAALVLQRKALGAKLTAFPTNVGVRFGNWIWAVSELMRTQMAYKGKELQRKTCENITIKMY